MNNKVLLQINNKEDKIEKILIDIIDENVSLLSKYNNFYFFREQIKEEQSLKIYFDKDDFEVEKIKIRKNKDSVSVKNDVEFTGAEDLFGKLGDEFLAEFLKAANYSAINIIRNSLDNYSKKVDIGIDILILNAAKNFKTIKEGYIVYAAFVEGFFTRWKDMDKIRAVFENNYLKNREIIYKKIKYLTSNEYYDENTMFIKCINKLRSKCIEEFKSGNLKIFKEDDNRNPNLIYRSYFYKATNKNQEFKEYINTDLEYVTYRLITVFVYRLMTNIGIKNVDEYLLAYYVYRAVEDIYNLKFDEYIKKFKREG